MQCQLIECAGRIQSKWLNIAVAAVFYSFPNSHRRFVRDIDTRYLHSSVYQHGKSWLLPGATC